MCMATSELRLISEQQHSTTDCRRAPFKMADHRQGSLQIRIRIMSIFSYSFSYARHILAVSIGVYFIQQAVTKEGGANLSSLVVVSLLNKDDSPLNRSYYWAAALCWAMMVYTLLHHKCRDLWQQVADFTRRTTAAIRSSSSRSSATTTVLSQGVMAASTMLSSTSTQACLSKMRSSVSLTSMRLFGVKNGKVGVDCVGRSLVISQKECFLQPQVLSDLTLKDIQHLFMYAVESNATDFELTKFLASVCSRGPAAAVSPAAKTAIAALEKVLASSRGIHVQPSQRPATCSGNDVFGSMDALSFAGAVRVFAEWRSLRLVPEGNQRYGVGMSLARRDLVHNVGKIERAVHAWMGFHQGVYDRSSNELKTVSPTIRQLLQHEIELRVHARLPVLADKSAASGLLWAKRQIHYQTSIFQNLSQIPFAFPSSKAAVNAAYEEVYGKYHGFFVRHIFQTSFEAAPDASVILNHMNAPYLDHPRCTQGDHDDDATARTENAANDISVDEDDEDDDWIHHPVDDHDHNSRFDDECHAVAFETPSTLVKTILHRTTLRDQLAREWGKFLEFWGQCAGDFQFQQQQLQYKHPRTAFASSPALRLSSLSDESDECDSCQGVAAGNCSSNHGKNSPVADIHGFVEVMQPMIQGLNNLISQFNMNDPTKV